MFPKTFPLVAQLADKEDAVSREILSGAAVSLAGLASSVVKELGWQERDVPLAEVGGVFGRSKFFDAAIESELTKVIPRMQLVSAKIPRRKLPFRWQFDLPVRKGMPPESVSSADRARTASSDELKSLVRDASERRAARLARKSKSG